MHLNVVPVCEAIKDLFNWKECFENYPGGVSACINQKKTRGKLYSHMSAKPSDARKQRKIVASQPSTSEPALDVVEAGEIPTAPPRSSSQRDDEQRKRPPLRTGELPLKKKACNFQSGSSSRGPPPVSPGYRSTQDHQFPRYTGYHSVNYGCKAPIVSDTEASLAALKKISMYGLDTLIAEVAQNLANLDHLFRGGLAPLVGIRDHQKILSDLDSPRSKLRLSKSKVSDLASGNSLLHTNNAKRSKDVGCKYTRIAELEKKNKDLQTKHTQAMLDKIQAEAQASLNKSLLDSFEITLAKSKLQIVQLEVERADLQSRLTVTGVMAQYNEQSAEMDTLTLKLAESDLLVKELKGKLADRENFLQTDIKKNLDDYNDLVQYGPILYPDFDAAVVHKWVEENPRRIEELQLQWAEEDRVAELR